MSTEALFLFLTAIAVTIALTIEAAHKHSEAADELFNGAVEAD